MEIDPEKIRVAMNDPITDVIKRKFGQYDTPPGILLVRKLTEKCGCWGQVHRFGDGRPTLIFLDERAPLSSLVHELLEWRFLEGDEEYSHLKAMRNESRIMYEITPIGSHVGPIRLRILELLRRMPSVGSAKEYVERLPTFKAVRLALEEVVSRGAHGRPAIF